MPPEENKLKIGLDPVFKGLSGQPKEVAKEETPVTAFNVLNNQKYTPSQTATPPNPAPSINIDPNKKSLVRTYKGDIESAIQTSHLSSINIALAENQRKQEQISAGFIEETPVDSGNYSKNKIIIFISLTLVFFGIIGLTIFFLISGPTPEPVVKIQELPSLITTEYKDEMDTTLIPKDRIIRTLSSKLNDIQIPVNAFYNVYMTIGTGTERRLAKTDEFISLLNFDMPDIIRRTLLPDYMVGMFMFGQNLPFIIFKTTYFENAYAGMFEWEKNIENDFRNLFRLSGYQESGGTIAELAPATSKKFSDAVIINKDVRILKNDTGEITILYAIIDKETIIITVNDVAFKEILNRLNKEKGLKR